ncbi:unnamed protein product [Arabidopsis thaliana]|uniref:F-box domain-containing protein n=1 Tax=Arabidopsis thaliana TaxID=3702 RepID=A0A654FHQ4_ARATH|nr:unnamed protein product [Arabidopsis thaliana]
MKLARQIEAMTISHLPTELLEEILSRLPLKSTRAVRSTCKKWDSLFKNRSFISKAAAAREGESQMVVLMDHNLHLVSFFFGSDSSVDTTIQIQNNLVVWNPYWGQTRWIKPRCSFEIPQGCDMYRYAIGYDNKRRNHKILRFIDYEFHYPRDNVVLWYEIYDFESDLWTTLDVTTPHWLINCGNRGVTLKGNTYWCAKKRNSDLFLNADHIICFDFTSERFGPLLLLPFSDLDGVVTLACVREEKLAALVCHEDVVEVWITIKIEANEVLWSKFLTVNVDLGDEIPSSLTYGSFFIDEEKKVAMIFDKTLDRGDTVHIMGEAGYGGQVDLGEPINKRRCPLVCSYVPSLVQIKKPAGFQRKQQSKLEKRQYVRNISKLRALKTQSSWTLSMSLECHQQ